MPTLTPYCTERSLPDRRFQGYGRSEVYDSAGIGLGDCLMTIKTRWRAVTALIVVVLLATAVVLFTMTPQYRATALVMIEPEPPHLMDVATLLERIQEHDQGDYDKTQYALLTNDQIAAQVIHDLKLEENPEFRHKTLIRSLSNQLTLLIDDATGRQTLPQRTGRFGVNPQALETYFSRLRVSPLSGTRLVAVSFLSPDPDLSARVVNAHVTRYVLMARQLQTEGSNTARTFLEKEAVDLEGKVEKSEAALNEYRNKMGILSFGVNDHEKNVIAEQRMLDLTKDLTEAETQRIKAEAEMEQVRSGDYSSLPEVVNNHEIQTLRPQIDLLQAQYAELSTRYTDQYPPMGEVKAKLVEAHQLLNADTQSIARAVERNYKAALLREQDLQTKVDREKQLDFSRNDASLEDAVLAREVETNREVYQDVLKRMQEISVNGAAPVSNISVVEQAVPPALPAIPQKVQSLLIALLASVICGIGLAFILEQLDDRLKSTEDIENYLRLPQLGVVPDFHGIAGPHPASALPGALSFLCSADNPAPQAKLIGRRRARRVASIMEFYKSVRSALLYSRAGRAPRTILFVSAVPGEGKTLTAAGTALAFAQTGARTLLVDADLRRPSCHRILGAKKSVGLSEILVGRAEVEHGIQRLDNWHVDEYEGLFFIGAGAPVPNPAELLASMKMFEVTQYVSNEYQFVLIDSAPLSSVRDTVGLATMVDGVVVVAGANTPKRLVRPICQQLLDAGAGVLGVVVNGADCRSPLFINAGFYGRYSPNGYLHSTLEVANPVAEG